MNLLKMHVADIFLLCIGVLMAVAAVGFATVSLTYRWGPEMTAAAMAIAAVFAYFGFKLIYRVFKNPLPILETVPRPAYRQKVSA